MFVALLALLFVGVESSVIQDAENRRPRGLRLRHEVHNNASLDSSYFNRGSCDVEQLEYRLAKLEVQIAEKSEYLRSELRQGSRRLEALEWRSEEVQTVLESFRNELRRFTETNQPGNPAYGSSNHQLDKFELRVENMTKEIQLVVATLRGIHSDIAIIKKNISSITRTRDTRTLVLNQDDVVTKPFLTAHVYHQPSTIEEKRFQIAENLPKNCKEVQERGHNISGIYRIQPELAPRAFMVLCDMSTRGGGWTFIHNRYEGKQDFYLNWQSYKLGFGNLMGEFWLGLDYLHQLTGSQVNELLVELVDLNLTKVHAHYSAFSVGNELQGYSLKVLGGYNGDAGDSLIYHAGSKFSTKDLDQDEWTTESCAQARSGAWWYKNCDNSNLNGKYLRGEAKLYQGMYWNGFRGANYSLLQARMMVRPKDDSFNFVPESY